MSFSVMLTAGPDQEETPEQDTQRVHRLSIIVTAVAELNVSTGLEERARPDQCTTGSGVRLGRRGDGDASAHRAETSTNAAGVGDQVHPLVLAGMVLEGRTAGDKGAEGNAPEEKVSRRLRLREPVSGACLTVLVARAASPEEVGNSCEVILTPEDGITRDGVLSRGLLTVPEATLSGTVLLGLGP